MQYDQSNATPTLTTTTYHFTHVYKLFKFEFKLKTVFTKYFIYG